MGKKNDCQDKEDAYVIGVAPSSYMVPCLMAVMFIGMAAVGIYRKGAEIMRSGSILMMVGMLCLAFPGPLCLVAVALIARVRLTLFQDRLEFRGAVRRWSLPWDQLKGVVIHHARPTGSVSTLVDTFTDRDVRDMPVAIIEFQTGEGRKCVRGMQTFKLNVDPEDLARIVEQRWRAHTGGEKLSVRHEVITPRDAWRLR